MDSISDKTVCGRRKNIKEKGKSTEYWGEERSHFSYKNSPDRSTERRSSCRYKKGKGTRKRPPPGEALLIRREKKRVEGHNLGRERKRKKKASAGSRGVPAQGKNAGRLPCWGKVDISICRKGRCSSSRYPPPCASKN